MKSYQLSRHLDSQGRGFVSLLASMTPSTIGEGESAVQAILQLLEAVVEVTDLEGDYEGEWWNVRQEVKGINRMDEGW